MDRSHTLHGEMSSSHVEKRQKSVQDDGLLTPQRDQYTIAWICALSIEMAAARAMLDQFHEPLPITLEDSNTYVLGNIKHHNVVIACLPAEQYGTNNAANVVTNMKRTFPAIRAGLMVGIGGGAPGKVDVRLGDVVVGTRVMQYDLGKVVEDGKLQRTAIPRILHQLLGTAVSSLRSKHELDPSRISFILQQKLQGHSAYARPSTPDRLFKAAYPHAIALANCDECDPSMLQYRGRRISNYATIHYGAIASGNQVMKSGTTRDIVAEQLDVICFEMEAAGLMDILPCLPIRGICDYSDSHKTKEWQRYAAATAAAYARELLEELSVTEGRTRISSGINPQQDPSDTRRQSLLNSLKFEQMDARRITITAAHARTCGWFPSHPEYEAWLDPARLKHHHGFLWISGKPGAGKSTMMKFAYSIMKNKASHNQSVVASFFFNARGDYLEKSISGMYRSLLLQLLEGYPSLQTVLDDLDLVPQNHNGCPSLNVLKELFYNAVSALGQSSFTCFIDALDECDEQQVVDMVQYFEDLTEQSTTDGIPFRICFSSRHYPYIGLQRGIRLTLENQLGHTEDLATYVASRLRIDDPALVEELRPQILGKAAGVFMWVVLVVDILNKEYRRGGLGLRRRLAEIPSDLSELFNDILRRDDENMEELLLCIMWILFATRPLQPRELYYALWSGLSLKDLADGQIPPVTVPDTSDGLNIFNRCVISSSKGIAEVTTSNQPTVQFIHESVRDFLIKDGGLHKLWPELGFDWEGRSHEILKQCCNMYMNHYLIHVTTSTVLSEPEYNVRSEISEKYPFLKYAGRHILYHANAAAKVVPQANFLRYFAMSNWISINNLFERSKDREYDPCVSLFYVLAERGFSDLIRTSFKAGGPLVGEGYHGPFFAAFANGHKDTIAALFNLPSVMYDGVDITEGLKSIELSDYEHRSPLSWASQTGRTGIVKLLLQAGAPVNEIDEGGRTSLSLASEKGHDQVALLLIENGAKLEAKTKDRLTPLLLAIQGGHVALSRLLIEKGAKVHARDRKYRTALFFASEKGHLATAKLLVERVDLESSDSHGFTPLAIATREGHKEVASLLMHNGADVNASDENRQSPLMVAALAGYKSIAELLINNGADVNASDSYGQTPLTIAVSGGFEPMARLLIDNGADINTGDRKSRTPLILASAKGNVEMVRLLLEKGADLHTRDVGGWTPLEVATEQDHRAVVRLLISQGA